MKRVIKSSLRSSKFIYPFVIVILVTVIVLFERTRSTEIVPPVSPEPLPMVQTELRLKRGETFASLLGASSLAKREIASILGLAEGKVDFTAIHRGKPIRIFSDTEKHDSLIRRIELSEDDLRTDVWERDELSSDWRFKQEVLSAEFRLLSFMGSVRNSLWNSAMEAQMDPSLISDLTEIFAWQIDFAREVRIGDQWRITVEQRLVRGKPAGWGRIIAAEYINDGHTHRALLYASNGNTLGYFSPEGKSLRKIFLKSPIKYSRIYSRFQRRRFHPVLRTYRPHSGVDYAAPHGTPIRAVGDGRIEMAGWQGGSGRAVTIRHNSVYQTNYKHLSGFAKGIRNGAQVKQGQVIGYVGSSGLATGPHLHFEFWENKRYVDPLGRDFPSADPIPGNLMADFQRRATILIESLPTSAGEVGGSKLEVSQLLSNKVFQEAIN